jgi:predicted transcriptional regulator
MVVHRRSLLQVRVLLQLESKPARTITELADQLNSQRPSVSRSLRILKDQGLVSRSANGWILTQTGRDEVATEKAALEETQNRIYAMAKSAAMLLDQAKGAAVRDSLVQAASGMHGVSQLIQSPALVNAMIGATKSNQLAGSVARALWSVEQPALLGASTGLLTAQAIANQLGLASTLSILAKALQPLVEAQQHNLSMMRDLAARFSPLLLEQAAKQNNIYLASAIDNVLSIRQSETIRLAQPIPQTDTLVWLKTDLARVSQAYQHLFDYRVAHVSALLSAADFPKQIEWMTRPTATVTFYTRSARSRVEAEDQSGLPLLPQDRFDEVGDESLDTMLGKLSPDFAEMRHGSWLALRSRSPDYLRHAGVSQRELLTQVLENLAPTAALPEDQRQGPQVKARLKLILGASDSDAEFADTLCKAMLSSYSQLNKYTHHNEKHEESLRALLHTGEGLIRFILSIARIP